MEKALDSWGSKKHLGGSDGCLFMLVGPTGPPGPGVCTPSQLLRNLDKAESPLAARS